jgi:hypothetical protein
MRGFLGRMNATVRGLLIVALIALVIVVLQLQATLTALAILLRIAFFIAIAVVLYLLWRDRMRFEIQTWGKRAQWVFYGSVLLIVLDLAAFFWERPSGIPAIAFLLVLAICGYAMFRTWREQRRFGY